MTDGINPAVAPSGSGCAECLDTDGWWIHLRRCAECGHVGCCDDSPSKHATAHYRETGHPIMQSFEPGENWFWNYPESRAMRGPALAPPTSRPDDQPVPGGQVPDDWQERLG